MFSDRVASMFSVIELFFGIGEEARPLDTEVHRNQEISGQIIGPVLGGLLYQIGGFTLPFAVCLL